MTPTVVHHERVETDTAVLCANGRIHCGPDYLKDADLEYVRGIADAAAERRDVTWCGGSPHYIAQRQRITTAWTAT